MIDTYRPVYAAPDRPLRLTTDGDPFTVMIGNLKGGSCKSTTAWCLAAELAHRGNRVLAVDADPTSQSLSDSYATAGGSAAVPFAVVQYPYAERFTETVTAAAAEVNANVIIIDTGGEATGRPLNPGQPLSTENPITDLGPFDVAGLTAHEIICPFAPSKMDVRRLTATYRAVKAFATLSTRDPGYRLLMARVPGGFAADGRAWRTELETDWPVMAAEIPDRAEYRRSFGAVPAPGGAYAAVVDELLTDRAETIGATP